MADDHRDDDIEYPPIPGTSIPDGDAETQLAWLRAQIAETLADDSPVIEIGLDEFFDDIKRRGRERLALARRAA